MSFSTVASVFLGLIGLAILLGAAWIVYTHLRARRLGLPPPPLSSYNPFHTRAPSFAPTSSSGGPFSWLSSQLRGLRNRNNRTAGGAYEEPLNRVGGRGANRGFGPLDPDEAWDARVGNEADTYGPGGLYDEQELGLTSGDTGYEGAAEQGQERGRRKSRDVEVNVGGKGASAAKNPFSDDAEPSTLSLRGVSPRPLESPPKGGAETPTERRSIFMEDMA